MLDYALTRLTHLEEVAVLIAAGVSPDVEQWVTEDDYNRASAALDAAQVEKIERLTHVKGVVNAC